jgi:hypothetical protein
LTVACGNPSRDVLQVRIPSMANASWHFAAHQLDCRSGNSICRIGHMAVDCIDASAQVAELN